MTEFLHNLDWTAIVAIVTSLTSLGIFAMFKALIKEIKDVVKVVREAKADHVITEKEMGKITKESMEAIEQVIKIGYLFKRIFRKK